MDTPLTEAILKALAREAGAIGMRTGTSGPRGHDGNNENLWWAGEDTWYLELHRDAATIDSRSGEVRANSLPEFIDEVRKELADATKKKTGQANSWGELRAVADKALSGSFGWSAGRSCIDHRARSTLALFLVLEHLCKGEGSPVSVRRYIDVSPDLGAPSEWVECRASTVISDSDLVEAIRAATQVYQLRTLTRKAFNPKEGSPIDRFLDAFEFRDPRT